MERITITFCDETYQKIKEHARKNANQPIAQSIRSLVELALKVESAASESSLQSQENDITSSLLAIKILLKNNLDWSLETRLLSRFFVENHPQVAKERQVEILEKYKESAQNYVKTLMEE